MTIENSVIARFEKFGEHFEILIDAKGAEEFKEGTDKSKLEEYLEIDIIFKDARKAEKASEESIKKIFGTNDVLEIAARILSEGEIQLTTEQRREILERKEHKIVEAIVRNAIDPRTNKPHPPDRIRNALEQAHFSVDLHKRLQDQIDDAIKAIRPILPIKFETLKLAIRIPAEYAPKAYTHLHHYKVSKEEWQKDGSLVALLEIPAGLQDEVYGELNSFTHGNVETRIMKDG
jgi:ribosome maturation protein SDO1